MSASRQVSLILAAALAAGLLVPACSGTTKYRVLSFFLDGVPRPWESPLEDYSVPSPWLGLSTAQTASGDRPAGPTVYSHPPYRENRCRSCHDERTGGVFRPPEEGLCRSCHTAIPGDARYVHGPVVVQACLFCHHHHRGPYRGMLSTDATTLCLRCHQRADLTSGEHHQTLDRQMCIECHNPHGGEDRFFVKRTEQ